MSQSMDYDQYQQKQQSPSSLSSSPSSPSSPSSSPSTPSSSSSSPSSFKRKIKSSIGKSCCFVVRNDENDNNNGITQFDFKESPEDSPVHPQKQQKQQQSSPKNIVSSSSSPSSPASSPSSSPSSWIKSKAHEFVSEEIKEKWLHLIHKIGRHGLGGTRKTYDSSDFKYDPLSYALNFDDEDTRFDDYPPLRDFSARLPQSPPPRNIEATHQNSKFQSKATGMNMTAASNTREVAAWS